MIDEIIINKYLQNIPDKNKNLVTKFMRMASAPFHLKIYVFAILILFLINKITMSQIGMILYSQIIIGIIKNTIKRKRPYQVDKNVKLLETMSLDEYSFPSVHTLHAFLLCYLIKKNININLDIIPYIVGLSRIYLGAHYSSDIFGAIILSKIVINLQ